MELVGYERSEAAPIEIGIEEYGPVRKFLQRLGFLPSPAVWAVPAYVKGMVVHRYEFRSSPLASTFYVDIPAAKDFEFSPYIDARAELDAIAWEEAEHHYDRYYD